MLILRVFCFRDRSRGFGRLTVKCCPAEKHQFLQDTPFQSLYCTSAPLVDWFHEIRNKTGKNMGGGES